MTMTICPVCENPEKVRTYWTEEGEVAHMCGDCADESEHILTKAE